jgi:hypothetical protein
VYGIDLSKARLMVIIGFSLCHASNQDRHSEAVLGIAEEFQVGAKLYVLCRLLQLLLQSPADVKGFIVARRYETLSLHHILQGFSTTDCDWLVLPGAPGCHHGRVSVTDSLKRRQLLEEFMFWYFDSFVIPLIKVRGLSVFQKNESNLIFYRQLSM